MSGWIKVHRSLLNWEWYTNPNCLLVFMTLLLRANYEDGTYRGVPIPKGSLTTSREMISRRTGLSVQTVRTTLRKLVISGEITIKTTGKFTMISITNWERFQGDNQQINPTINQESTSKVTTSKKIINKEDKKDISSELAIQITELFNSITGKRLGQIPSNHKHIKQRLKESPYTLEDFRLVIEDRFKDWRGNPKMSPHILPKTLFGEKFDGYLQNAKTAAKGKADPLDTFFSEFGVGQNPSGGDET